jgi:hypothetical protein
MEVDQGPNWGCSAKKEKKTIDENIKRWCDWCL